MRYENSVLIRRPVDVVFTYLMDVDAAPIWHSQDLDVQRLTRDPLGVGARLAVVAKVLGQTIKDTAEITNWDPPHAVRIEKPGRSVSLTIEFRFESEADGTRVTVVTDVNAGGMAGMMLPVAGPTLKRQGQEGLEGVKTLLEGAQPG